MIDIKFIKNEKETDPRILLTVNGIIIDTIQKSGNLVFDFTSQGSISNIFYAFQRLIKTQTGLDVTYNQILHAYEQLNKGNKMKLSNPFPQRILHLSALETEKIESWVYPGGEVGVRVPTSLIGSEQNVFFRLQSAQDIITLLMAIDANTRAYPTNTLLRDLIIPYIPYARQDRVATKGDPLAIKVLVDLIELTGANKVHCLDPHSEVTEHYFKQKNIEFHGYSPVFFIEHYINKIAPGKKVILVSPDKGAKKKTLSYLKELDAAIGVIVCRKSRDPVSGRLTQAEFEEYIPKQLDTDINIKDPNIDLVITDDICDGGRTFMNIVELLDYEGFKNPVHLWTSHAIYSYGIEGLLKKFKTLGSTNSFLHKHIHENLITIPLDQQ